MALDLVICILIFSPLVGFLINGLGGKWNNKNCVLAGAIATGAAAISFVCASILFCHLVKQDDGFRLIHTKLFQWIHVGSFKADIAFSIDAISAIMILIITGVGSLIHLYSIGYMGHDKKPAKYFAYLNLFLFSMLVLVTADNLLLMFVGWEGVGLCSYLLIGFWFTDPAKAAAGMKAFIVNRIGDAGFLLGLFTIFVTFGTIQFQELADKTMMPEIGVWGPITLATLFLFVGATGKSAQIPLYTWLPDAMAGPTPVSALIHAATMVTAGVYLIVRLNFMYVAAPTTMCIVACVGAATALFAAIIGVLQNDIKKILAYSTVSQLGYMFLAVGVGAFGAGMFHLMTHAFFKALMFLGSGSVIHGMHEEQDVRKMGGLAKQMPITHITFVFGWLAIIGTPLFSGFFSKDEILWMAYASPYGSKMLWVIGVVAAALTAFYMTRLMALTFWGKSRVDASVKVHESPLTMTIPLMVLAGLSLVGGWIGIPHVIGHPLHIPNILEGWLSADVFKPEVHGTVIQEVITMTFSVVLAGASAVLAYVLYVRRPEVAAELKAKMAPVHKLVSNKFYVDEIYDIVFVRNIIEAGRGLWAYVDVRIVDRVTYLASDIVMACAANFRILVNGNLQQYALFIVGGLVLILAVLFMG